jgi:hypothetical protein
MHSDAMNSNDIVFQSFYVLENHICSVNLQIILNHNIEKFLPLHSRETVKFFFFQIFFFINHALYMCYIKVLSTQHSLTHITTLYNRNNVNVLLLTSFLFWTHAITTTGTGKYQLYTCTTAFRNPAWLVLSIKYINRIIKLSSLFHKVTG